MPDVVLTAGLDTTEVTAAMRKLQVDSGLMAAQIDKAIAPATRENVRLSESVREVGHEVRGATKAFHHLVFAPVMIAGIAYEFYHLGGIVGEAIHDLVHFGQATEEAIHKANEEAEKFKDQMVEILGLRAKKSELVPVLDPEGLTRYREELDKVNARLAVLYALRERVGYEGVYKKERIALEARRDQISGDGGFIPSAMDRTRRKEQENADLAEQERRDKEDAKNAAEEEAWNNQALEYIDMQYRETRRKEEEASREEQRLQEETAREAKRLEDEAFRDAQEQNARVYDEWIAQEREKQRLVKERQREEEADAQEQSRIDDLAAQRSGFAGSSLAPGLFNASVGTGIFGLGSQSANNPQLAMHRTTNEKLDKANQTLASIERNTQNRAATFG